MLGDRKKPKKKERKIEEESENVRAWLNDYNDDIDEMIWCALVDLYNTCSVLFKTFLELLKNETK